MEGWTIPIEGDASALRRALDALQAAFADLAAAMQQQAAAAARGQQQVVRGLDLTLQRAAAVGSAAGGMASALGAAAQAARWFSRANMAASATQAVAAAGGLRSALGRVGQVMRQILASRTFKVLALGAIGAAAAVVTVRTAMRALSAGARAAGAVMRGVFHAAQQAAGGLTRAAKGAFASMRGGLGAIMPGALPIGGLLSLGAAVAIFGNETRKALSAAAGFEDVRVSVEQFLGSAEAAAKAFKELDEFEVKTPFEGTDIRAAFAGMLGAGIRDDVTGLVRELGAVAKTGEELRELGDAIGKGFARGRFQTEEMNKFLERQINLMPELEKITGQTGDNLRQAIEKGLDFGTVRQAIRGLSAEGGAFFGLLERRSLTTNGLMSTLASAFDVLRRSFGQPINDALKPMIAQAIELVNSLRGQAEALGKRFGEVMLGAFALIKSGKTFDLLQAGFVLAVATLRDGMMRALRGAVAFLAAALPPVFENAIAKLRDPLFWKGISGVLSAAGTSLAAEIKGALPMADQDEVEALRREAKIQNRLAQQDVLDSGKGGSFAAALADGLARGLVAASKAAQGEASPGLKSAVGDFNALLAQVDEQVARMRKDAAIPPPPAAPPAATARTPEAPKGALGRTAEMITTSLGRVGGGGFGGLFSPMLQEAKRTARATEQTARNTRELVQKFAGKGLGAAVYA